MSEIHNTAVANSKVQAQKRKPIDTQTKSKLINSVVQDHLPIYQAAILHKVKYSSAKHILRNYLSDTDNFFSMQRKRKRKIVCNNTFIIIDSNSGNVSLLFKKPQILPCPQEVTAPIQQRILNQMATAIQQEVKFQDLKAINTTEKICYRQNVKNSEKIENKINALYIKLKNQHEMMQNLIFLQ